MLAVSLWMILSNWHDVKGSLFIDLASLRSAEGKIVTSSTYTSSWRSKTYYHYSIVYEFTVNGKNYRSDEVTFNDNYSLEQEFAQKYISKYYLGKTVVVHYDPHDPSFSVLEPEEKGDAVVKLFFVAIFVSMSALFGGYLIIRRVFFTRKQLKNSN